MSIKRYSESGQAYDYEGMQPDSEGDWVKYADHEAEVARMREALAVEQGVAYTAIQHLRANGFPFDEALVRKHYEEAGR